MSYFRTDSIIINSEDSATITENYNRGYVFTRLGKGEMDQTRSLRIDLEKFELNSENRRILRKNENLSLEVKPLPLADYSWEIHKLGKDFYTQKFGDGTMSAAKIKEMFNESDKSNMTSVFIYTLTLDEKNFQFPISNFQKNSYCLAYINDAIVHYAYPFYDLEVPKEQNIGIGMMTKAIVWAKENNKKYIYLGSIIETSSLYKLQFEGLEWWDTEGNEWSSDLENLKGIILISN